MPSWAGRAPSAASLRRGARLSARRPLPGATRATSAVHVLRAIRAVGRSSVWRPGGLSGRHHRWVPAGPPVACRLERVPRPPFARLRSLRHEADRIRRIEFPRGFGRVGETAADGLPFCRIEHSHRILLWGPVQHRQRSSYAAARCSASSEWRRPMDDADAKNGTPARCAPPLKVGQSASSPWNPPARSVTTSVSRTPSGTPASSGWIGVVSWITRASSSSSMVHGSVSVKR